MGSEMCIRDSYIGVEASALVALVYAADDTEAFKLALARAAQVIIDFRDATDLDTKPAGKMQSERIAAALQNIVDANSNFNAALHAARLVDHHKSA